MPSCFKSATASTSRKHICTISQTPATAHHHNNSSAALKAVARGCHITPQHTRPYPKTLSAQTQAAHSQLLGSFWGLLLSRRLGGHTLQHARIQPQSATRTHHNTTRGSNQPLTLSLAVHVRTEGRQAAHQLLPGSCLQPHSRVCRVKNSQEFNAHHAYAQATHWCHHTRIHTQTHTHATDTTKDTCTHQACTCMPRHYARPKK